MINITTFNFDGFIYYLGMIIFMCVTLYFLAWSFFWITYLIMNIYYKIKNKIIQNKNKILTPQDLGCKILTKEEAKKEGAYTSKEFIKKIRKRLDKKVNFK